jgi:hypothetical protein
MADFYRVGARLSLAGILSLSAMSCYANGWSEDFLSLTGTAIAFDSEIVQNALTNEKSPDLGELLQKTGMKPWAGARVWLVQSIDNKILAFPSNKTLETEANRRGLIINNTIKEADKISLQQALAQPKTDGLKNLLSMQRSDVLVVLSKSNNHYSWQLNSPTQRFIGTMTIENLKYLPHIWSENLALAYQWPELKNNTLIHINGIKHLTQLKAAESTLKTGCTTLQVLKVSSQNVYFSCKSTNSLAPEKFTLNPQLVAQPLLTLGLDENVWIGQQLAQRYISYQWRDFY